VGFVPRLCRKPINSGICWSILETVNNQWLYNFINTFIY
jgi:hypothetical protein